MRPAGSDLLFVYGTLRRDCGHPAHAWLLGDHATFIGAGEVAGRLVVVDWYPGLVLAGASCVRGEVWRVDDPSWWSELDAYEGLDPANPSAGEFTRRRVLVAAQGHRLSAWTYLLQSDPAGLEVVASGDWLDHCCGI
jgi:gamma-glutamylcyclotransferase (GGCT)/AIG2-like uncharacterized protein YtfP